MISKSSIFPICHHDAELIFHGANQASQEDLLGFNQVLIEIRAPYCPNFLVKIDIRAVLEKKIKKTDLKFSRFSELKFQNVHGFFGPAQAQTH